MQLPKRLRVGPYRYTVSPQPNVHSGDGSRDFGSVNHLDGSIIINSTADADRQVATFWHELMHAFDHCYNIDLSEAQTDQLGNALAAFFIDNPSLAPAWSKK
mgnify:CR=1 FL=1